jgi:ferric-dicitrate binding protein FerR (iron transport regulator)
MITKELIDRYFKNECTNAERDEVLRHFEKYPGDWDQFISENEWEQFETSIELSRDFSDELFEKVSMRTTAKTVHRMQLQKWLSVAAVILVAVAGIWIFAERRLNDMKQNDNGALITVAENGLHKDVNNSVAIKKINLADGSVVELFPNSSIEYAADFGADNKRLIYLNGKASFKVAKDKTRPFTVFSGDIGTTALGTYFTVEAYAGSNEIRVALYEGKVVVKSNANAVKKMLKDAYLLPGDELIYNKKTGLAVLNKATAADKLVKASPLANNGTDIHRPDWYQFEGQTLPEVLDQLSAYYQVTIYYYPAQLSNRYFTGKIEKTDSLDNVLNDISLLNHLIIRKEKDSSYLIITKSH